MRWGLFQVQNWVQSTVQVNTTSTWCLEVPEQTTLEKQYKVWGNSNLPMVNFQTKYTSRHRQENCVVSWPSGDLNFLRLYLECWSQLMHWNAQPELLSSSWPWPSPWHGLMWHFDWHWPNVDQPGPGADTIIRKSTHPTHRQTLLELPSTLYSQIFANQGQELIL